VCQVDFITDVDRTVRKVSFIRMTGYLPIFLILYLVLLMTLKSQNMEHFIKANMVFVIKEFFVD
jgi:hypothetical protein